MNKFTCCRWRKWLCTVLVFVPLSGEAWAQAAGGPASSGLASSGLASSSLGDTGRMGMPSLGADSAGASGTDPAEAGARRMKALHRVSQTCRAETERFCPTLTGDGRARDQALCLKYYKPNLSLGCRSSVTAATAP